MSISTGKLSLGQTQSTCGVCQRLLPAKVVCQEDEISLEKWCPDHGSQQAVVWRGLEGYLDRLTYVRPGRVPLRHDGDDGMPCPTGCGFCSRHEQHLCLPIVEITSRCDLNCPICLVNAGGDWDMTPAEFQRVLDKLIAAEGQLPVINLSGGEPLRHPRLLQLVDLALGRPEIVRVTISTNGLGLLREPALLGELQARGVVVSLQCDGFDDSAYLALRGRPLAEEKRRTLEALGEADVSTSLTMTVAGGVNEHQYGPMLDLLFSRPHIVSLMLQPLAFAGRATGLRNIIPRLTVPEVEQGLGSANHPAVDAEDFLPLPCCHPLCFSLAYYLALDDGSAISLKHLSTEKQLLDAVTNQVFFGLNEREHEHLRQLAYDLWSSPAADVPEPEVVLRILREVLRDLSAVRSGCGCFAARDMFRFMERRVKSIFIHAFQDAETLDLARVRRCCNAYPQADGRLLPVCARNNLPHLEGARHA